jgi:CRAL/TRIO domain
VFPLPGLETKGGHEVLYMRPSRFNPSESPIEDMIDPLVYVMNVMTEKERNATNGITVIANFKGWEMKNFSMEYFYILTMMLQGAVPTRVVQFLIVDPPQVFIKIAYPMMKRMLTSSFQKRLHIIDNAKSLNKYLKRGYEDFLPKEMPSGHASSSEIVKDFYDLRKHLEATASYLCPTVAKAEPDSTDMDFSSTDFDDSSEVRETSWVRVRTKTAAESVRAKLVPSQAMQKSYKFL